MFATPSCLLVTASRKLWFLICLGCVFLVMTCVLNLCVVFNFLILIGHVFDVPLVALGASLTASGLREHPSMLSGTCYARVPVPARCVVSRALLLCHSQASKHQSLDEA